MPPKMASKEEERKNRLLERKESDLTRLTAAKSKLEGQRRHWEEKKEEIPGEDGCPHQGHPVPD